MIKSISKYLLFACLLCMNLAARDVVIKNADKFPITISWVEVLTKMPPGRGRRPHPTYEHSPFTETIPPLSEKTIKVGEKGDVGQFKITIMQGFEHLNKNGLNEFNISIPTPFSGTVHIEFDPISTVRALLGSKSLVVKYAVDNNPPSQMYILTPDLNKILSASGADVSFELKQAEGEQL